MNSQPEWLKRLSPQEQKELERVREKRDKAVSDYNVIKRRLKARADARIWRERN